MNISRAEQRTLHALAQGGAIALERDEAGRILRADCFTRDGFLLTDCTLSVWKKLKNQGADRLDRRRSLSGQPRRAGAHAKPTRQPGLSPRLVGP
jgi:hypothetical protein